MTSNSLSAVEKKIKELVPDPMGNHCEHCECDDCYCMDGITLADVLRAILAGSYALSPAEFTNDSILLISEAEIDGEYPSAYWKLALPLSGQSEECLSFLASLLGNN